MYWRRLSQDAHSAMIHGKDVVDVVNTLAKIVRNPMSLIGEIELSHANHAGATWVDVFGVTVTPQSASSIGKMICHGQSMISVANEKVIIQISHNNSTKKLDSF